MMTRLCSHRYARVGTPNLVVVHTNEGPEAANGAVALANYMARPDISVGYHYVIDDTVTVRTAWESERVNGAGGVNSRSVHVCLIGHAAQNATQWSDPYSLGELAQAAPLVRDICDRNGIPKVKINAADLRANGAGICAHADVSQVYAASEGHTDPGPAFPWGSFMQDVLGRPAIAGEDVVRDSILVIPKGRPDVWETDYTIKRWIRSEQRLTNLARVLGQPQPWEPADVDEIPAVGIVPDGYTGQLADKHA